MNCIDDIFGIRPLIFKLIALSKPELIKVILRANPDLSKTHEDASVLEYAEKYGNEEIVELLKKVLK